MLMDANGQQLVTGACPVDGPVNQASATRSELYGRVAAPLEYIHQFARYCSMRPNGL
jgi:hypothetical protein